MVKTKSKKPTMRDKAKSFRALKAIHDMLYWDMSHSGEMFYNGKKEWSVDLLDDIAGVVGIMFPRPVPVEICDDCGKPCVESGTGHDGRCPGCVHWQNKRTVEL
jgi:hypothetical protein